jgi:ligand-binding sensor domain-containing protein
LISSLTKDNPKPEIKEKIMKAITRIFALAALAAIGVFIIAGCSSDDSGKNSSKSQSFTDQVIDDFVENTFASADTESATADLASTESADQETFADRGPQFHDVILKDNVVYAAMDNGVLTYALSDGATALIPTDDPIWALVDLGDKILAGGDKLYVLEDGVLNADDYQLNLTCPITVLHPYGMSLLIGTSDGLYVFDFDGIRELAGGIDVSAITQDAEAVWIGTAGQGLYRWDGETFRKRYLKRDSTLFDNVLAMHFNHDHLYLGTDKGFFVYDGGSWQPYGLADGLPSEVITAVNASDWVIKIGTARGAVTFYDGQFKLMPKLESTVVTEFIKDGSKLLAATSNAGLIMKSGGLVTTLYDGEKTPAQIALEEVR